MTAASRDFAGGMLEAANVTLPVKGGVRIYGGTMVGVDSLGRAVPATATTTIRIVGKASRQADNRYGADGEIMLPVLTGADGTAHGFLNDPVVPVVPTMFGLDCYALDDQTVSASGTGRAVAGRIVRVTPTRVFIRFL